MEQKRRPHRASHVASQKTMTNAFEAWWDQDWFTPEARETQIQEPQEDQKTP
ncbi:Hypothetical predicted protein, partial [Pelobates cultripes]